MEDQRVTKLLFELSQPGRTAADLPKCAVQEQELKKWLPAEQLSEQTPPLPELSESDVVRHFISLSKQNMSVDTHFYPLGSCTMKYNPKRNERLAGLPGLVDLHPYQNERDVQGLLRILFELQQMLAEIAGLPAVSLQPAAGAHGELTSLLVAAAYFRSKGERQRTQVILPASAHGTNPASAALAGFECVQLEKSESGLIEPEQLKNLLSEKTAVLMVTNPNTLGLFETHIHEVSRMVHEVGGLVYIDGANMNAIMGVTRPGDFGGDMMHFNVHKTFASPHGAGGPGAGPIAVRDFLAEFLPSPVVAQREDGSFYLKHPSRSIGRVRSFFGSVNVLLRGYFYLRTLGAAGVRRVTEDAVLNANYLLAKLHEVLDVPHGRRCMHEFVASAQRLRKERNISAMDIAKRLLDYGFHPPTVYFPLVVSEALMIEPTETESRETLDAFAETLRQIVNESPETLHAAPHSTRISRPDEVRAARQPKLRWQPENA